MNLWSIEMYTLEITFYLKSVFLVLLTLKYNCDKMLISFPIEGCRLFILTDEWYATIYLWKSVYTVNYKEGDNASSHTTEQGSSLLLQNVILMAHPLYISDLAPCDFLFSTNQEKECESLLRHWSKWYLKYHHNSGLSAMTVAFIKWTDT